MPTYVYECPDCGQFEEYQSIKDDPIQKCPDCNSEINRVIQPTLFAVKGDIKTLGQLAENNAKKHGKLWQEKQIYEQEQLMRKIKNDRLDEMEKAGKKVTRPDFDKKPEEISKRAKEVVKSGDAKQIEKYVMEGK